MLQFSLNFVNCGECCCEKKRTMYYFCVIKMQFLRFFLLHFFRGRVLELGKCRNWFFTTSQVLKSKTPPTKAESASHRGQGSQKVSRWLLAPGKGVRAWLPVRRPLAPVWACRLSGGGLGCRCQGRYALSCYNSRVAERVLLSPDAVPEGAEQSWTVVMGGGGEPLLVAFNRSAWTWVPQGPDLCPDLVLMALFHHSLVLILSEGKGLLMKGLSFQAPGASAQFPVLLNTVDFH